MAQVFGLDIERMTALAADVDRSAATLDGLAQSALVGTNESVAFWVGHDAEQFRHSWTSTHNPALRLTVAELQGVAELLRANRDDQALTSSALDGAGPGRAQGPPIGPGGRPGIPVGDLGHTSWNGSFVFGDRNDGRLVGEYSNDIAFGAGAAGNYRYMQLPGGGFVLVADVDARSGFQAQTGGSGEFWGIDAQGQAGIFVGGRGNGDFIMEVSPDQFTLGANGEVFLGTEAYANGRLGGDTWNVEGGAYAQAGAGAEGTIFTHVDSRNVSAAIGGDAFLGARTGVEGDTSFLDGDIQAGGGVGVSYGLGAGAHGGGSFGLDEVGVDLDLALAFGLGFDASVDVSFSPSGLADDVGGAATGVYHFAENNLNPTNWFD